MKMVSGNFCTSTSPPTVVAEDTAGTELLDEVGMLGVPAVERRVYMSA